MPVLLLALDRELRDLRQVWRGELDAAVEALLKPESAGRIADFIAEVGLSRVPQYLDCLDALDSSARLQ